jgi:hypothetical protein
LSVNFNAPQIYAILNPRKKLFILSKNPETRLYPATSAAHQKFMTHILDFDPQIIHIIPIRRAVMHSEAMNTTMFWNRLK